MSCAVINSGTEVGARHELICVVGVDWTELILSQVIYCVLRVSN